MEVYIEYVILDNLIINYLLLNLTNFTLKLSAKKWRMWLSGVVGTIVAIFLPLLNISSVLLFIIKIVLGLVLVLIIKKPKNIKNYFVTFFLFLTYTFCLGGMCFGLLYLLNVKTTFSGIILYNIEIPISIFIILILIYLKILWFLIRNVKKKNTFHNFYYDVKITNNLKSINVCGFLDSGNQLNCDGNGFIVVSYKIFLKLFPNINYQKLVMGDLLNCGLKNAKFIKVGSAVSKNNMLIFNVDELVVSGNGKLLKLNKPMMGLSKVKFNGEYECLLSPNNF